MSQDLGHQHGTPVWASEQPAVPRAPRHGAREQHAEAAEAGRLMAHSATAPAERSPLATDHGLPLDPRTRRQAERLLGTDLDTTRVHDGPDARDFTELLGARAATHGRDVFLGPGESATDQTLMNHELAHVADGGDTVALRPASYFERRAWLSFYSHYLPRKFLNHYMDDVGTPIVLTLQEMEDCNAIVDIKRSVDFMTAVATLKGAGGGSKQLRVKGAAGARTNGTLGNFTVIYTGTVTVNPDGTWIFVGDLKFHDYWDFDPKGSGSNRPWLAEAKVRVANWFLPGSPFSIDSVAASARQSNSDPRAMWGSMRAPVHVPDNLGRSGADITVGDVAGAPAGPVGDVGGAEAGAQASEDLNR
jgi:hypothetical protein